MCGLLAVTHLDQLMDRMSDGAARLSLAMQDVDRRGIRSSSVWGEDLGSPNTLFRHARLPILGLSEENDQPRVCGPWVFMYVGEMHNYREHYPPLSCDTQAAVATWLRGGPEGFREFDGFWSLVAYNTTTGALHLLVDYLAQKPLYYRTDGPIAVANDPGTVARLGKVTPDRVYLSSVIKWGYCPDTRRTPYREVQRTEPGEHVVIYPTGRVERSRVDTLEPTKVPDRMLAWEIEEAVKNRVESSDVPLSILLSGGLDSAIVYTLARRYTDQLQVYHVENGEYEALERLNPENVTLLPLGDVSQVAAGRLFGEPVDLGSLKPQICLARAIANSPRRTHVCLTGDGADELFGGYGRSQRYDSQASDVWQELVAWHLPRLDRIMAQELVEVRSPFLSRGVAEMALGTPWSRRRDKGLLRDLFRDRLPKGVADTPKRPLRTGDIERDREQVSRDMVDQFYQQTWGDKD